MALVVASALPKAAPASPNAERLKPLLQEFHGLCAELAQARERLGDGTLTEEAFADSLLALFVRADSLAARLAAGPRGNPVRLTLQRGTASLIDALRDNWVGIAGRNGMSFAQADLALKAAIAWKSNVSEASAGTFTP